LTRRLEHILDHATEVFCSRDTKGAIHAPTFPRAHRHVAGGLYYYFESKERLAF